MTAKSKILKLNSEFQILKFVVSKSVLHHKKLSPIFFNILTSCIS